MIANSSFQKRCWGRAAKCCESNEWNGFSDAGKTFTATNIPRKHVLLLYFGYTYGFFIERLLGRLKCPIFALRTMTFNDVTSRKRNLFSFIISFIIYFDITFLHQYFINETNFLLSK